MPQRNKVKRSAANFKVEEKFDLGVLKGVVAAKTSAESGDDGCKQTISYRCFGKRVYIKATSLIKDGSSYGNVPPRDSLTMRGTKWTHVGETPSGSSAWVDNHAGVLHEPASRIEVVLEVLADRPRGGKVRSRTVYLPLG